MSWTEEISMFPNGNLISSPSFRLCEFTWISTTTNRLFLSKTVGERNKVTGIQGTIFTSGHLFWHPHDFVGTFQTFLSSVYAHLCG